MFCQCTLDFLYFNRLYNSPEWYKSHKFDCERYVLGPLKEFTEEIAPAMKAIDKDLIVEPKACVSRIFRDMRFATDGYRYRENMWCMFIRDKKLYNGLPGYFFEVSPYCFKYGCGYYQADSESLKNFRSLILSNSKEFQKTERCFKRSKDYQMEGETQRSIKRYDDLSPIANDWLNRTNICLIAQSRDINLFLSEELVPFIAERFRAIKPFYELILKAENMKGDKN